MSGMSQRLSVQEYLERESFSDTKHDYLDGEVCAMPGGSVARNRVASNLMGELGRQLAGKSCMVNPPAVVIKAGRLYTHADVSVVCPPVERAPGPIEVVLNPRVIALVLSPATER
jgi:Uma2 family endonuclease